MGLRRAHLPGGRVLCLQPVVHWPEAHQDRRDRGNCKRFWKLHRPTEGEPQKGNAQNVTFKSLKSDLKVT